jgi:hypothetical protein
MVRHPISQTSGVKILPSAGMERWFVRKSGAVDAEFIFLRLKSLGVHGLKLISWEIYRMFIMGWNWCVERFMFMDCLQIVYRWFGTQSLKHLALRFGRRRVLNADSWVSLVPEMPRLVFCDWNLSECLVGFYDYERFGECYDKYLL